MKDTILIVVNTPFQMITAIQLSATEYSNKDVDIIITDNIAQYKDLSNRAKKSGLFNRVYTMVTKDVKWKSWMFTDFGFIYNRKILDRLPFLKEKKRYEIVLFANTGGVAECIATFLNKKYKSILEMYEDGFLSYSDFYYNEIRDAFSPRRIKSRILYLLRKRGPAYVKCYHVYEPNLIKNWKFPFEIRGISKIDFKTITLLNEVFDYKNHKENYEYKYIFFEESYYADGKDIGDLNIVEKIAEIVGKDNLMIKIHPRNPVNRFKTLGYHTNLDTSLPWEIIAMNINLDDKTLITIASGSSITSYFISGRNAKRSVLLYEMDSVDRKKLTPSLSVFDKICKSNNYFVYPQNFDELKQILLK